MGRRRKEESMVLTSAILERIRLALLCGKRIDHIRRSLHMSASTVKRIADENGWVIRTQSRKL